MPTGPPSSVAVAVAVAFHEVTFWVVVIFVQLYVAHIPADADVVAAVVVVAVVAVVVRRSAEVPSCLST
jgi:hypothetical protein